MQCIINLVQYTMNKICLEILRIEHQEETHQEHSLSKIFLLKCFTVFFLLVSFYPFKAYSIPPDFYEKIPQNNPSSEAENTLTTEETEEQSINEEGPLDKLIRTVNTLPIEFFVDLVANGIFIVSGGVLLLTPAGQVAIATLMSGKIIIKGAHIGVFAWYGSFVKTAKDVEAFLTEDEKKAVTFLANIAIKNSVVKELIVLLYSIDEDLSESVFHTHILENLRKELIYSIGDDRYSVPEREALISALRGFPDIEEGLGKEAIESLKQIIDNSIYPSLRQTSVSTLGQIGEGVEGVAEYLIGVGVDPNKSDELRFLALIELGRDKDNFLTSIEELSTWIEDRNNTEKLLIQPEVPDSFINSLLSTKEEESSEQHIIVLKGLIRSEILELGLELKLKFSETLLNWDDSVENKIFLREVYLNPTEDIISYVEKELFKEGLSDDDYEALDFLTNELSDLEKNNTAIKVLYDIEPIIEDFKIHYPNQVEIAQTLEWLTTKVKVLEKPNPIRAVYDIDSIIKKYFHQVEIAQKLENIVNSYKKILESIQN